MKIKLTPINDSTSSDSNTKSSDFIDLTIISSALDSNSYNVDDEMLHYLHPSLVAGEPIIGVDVIFAKDIINECDDIITPLIRLYNELANDGRSIYGESILLQPWDLVQIAKAYEQFATKDYSLMYTRELAKPLAKLINAITDSNYIAFLTYHKNKEDCR